MARTLLNSAQPSARQHGDGKRDGNADGVALAARCSCSKLKKCKCCTLYSQTNQQQHGSNSHCTPATYPQHGSNISSNRLPTL